MDNIRILIDFGSTFTKVVAVNLGSEEIFSRVQVPSTVDTDITIGLREALEKIGTDVKIGELEKRQALACSSAAGGLRMICVGFVPDLTSEAANRAALGAGAKVVGRYSYELTGSEIKEIEAIAPDIVLLSGGTDGGDKKTILNNARRLSGCSRTVAHIVVAGNKMTCDEIDALFKESGKHVSFTENVMPEIGRLETGPSNEIIREIFIKNIIKAKGLDKAKLIINEVIMPTPSAVLEAAKLLSKGYKNISGMGELLIVDVGGSTTDVHSVAEGKTNRGAFIQKGLPEPYVKRTVEGDLGLKHNLENLIRLAKGKNPPRNFDRIFEKFFEEGEYLESEEEIESRAFLTRLAVDVAVERHVGRVEMIHGPAGEITVQRGKDLTQVECVIGTGGPIVFSNNPREILEAALFQEENPAILRPKSPRLFIDEKYVLYTVGLLAETEPRKALNLLKKHLVQV